ncbi:hypothetical protein, partial [Nocardia neocaledoniensis]|uniref:hypothetical protein n=1 Tax=Nocardia neocaledoniensis TaxID=236511 RepID=UPI0024552233
GMVVSSTTAPSLLLPKVGPKVVISGGFLVAAAGMLWLTRIGLDTLVHPPGGGVRGTAGGGPP